MRPSSLRPLAAGTLAISVMVTAAGWPLHGQGPGGGPPQQGALLPAQATGVILGRVVEADSKTPVAGALVRLSGPALGAPASMRAAGSGTGPRMFEADSAGRFVFTDLPKGSYFVDVTAPGYLGGRYGQDRLPSPIARTLDPVRQLNLGDGETRSDVAILMWHEAVITGTVLDENGDPMVGIQVRVDAVSDIWIGRLRGGGGSGAAATDDRGIYRFDLVPGDYIVSVGAAVTTMPAQVVDDFRARTGTVAGTQAAIAEFSASGVMPLLAPGLHIGDEVVASAFPARNGGAPPMWMGPDNGPLFVYPVTYYPSAPLADGASVVTVKSGEERAGVDFQLRPQPTFRVTGHVVGPSGPVPDVGVRLTAADWDKTSSFASSFNATTAVTDAQGAFVLFGVVPGQYLVDVAKVPVAARDVSTSVDISTGAGGRTVVFGGPVGIGPPSTDPILWAAQPLVVSQSDVTDLTISATPGGRISGRFEFTPPEQMSPAVARAVSIVARPVPGSPPARFNVPTTGSVIDDGGGFTTSQLVPGKYVITPGRLSAGWVLRSAMTGGHDAADDPIDLDAAGLSDMVVTFTNQPTVLTGTVTPEDGPPSVMGVIARSPTVIAFPTDARYWPKYAFSPRRLRTAGASSTLTYSITGLPAGEYFVAASTSSVDFTDPKVLAYLAKLAPKVTLVEGESRAVDVRAAAVPAIR